MPTIWLNGRFTDEAPIIDSSNRAFRYGDGLFETVRICFGKAVFFHQHYVRFIEGMTLLKMEVPESWSFTFLQNLLQECAQKNGHTHARIRMSCWRDGAGWYLPLKNTPALLIESYALEQPYFQMNVHGLAIGAFKDVQLETGPLANFKSANALPYILAALWAKEQAFDNAILFNRNGSVADAIQSNIFVWKNNTLITPDVNQGCVNGVMRRTLLKHARSWGMPVEERVLELSELDKASEVFLTNAVQGIQWVEKWDDTQFDNKISSALLGKLNELLPVN